MSEDEKRVCMLCELTDHFLLVLVLLPLDESLSRSGLIRIGLG